VLSGWRCNPTKHREFQINSRPLARHSLDQGLVARVSERTNGRLQLGSGSVYPALRDLEREGLVESREADPSPERGGRPRRYYKLTAEGLRALKETRAVVRGLFELVPVGAR
jgi:PadR family transcriptional regulator PadR